MNRNEQVLTLFARINPSDIKKLAEKCERFLSTRLSERNQTLVNNEEDTDKLE